MIKFDAQRQQAFLNFDDFVSCCAADIDNEMGTRQDGDWHEYAQAKYDALPDIQLSYDSTADTLAHIRRVSALLNNVAIAFLSRAIEHDNSKLLPPEKYFFDTSTPRLKGLTYGSPEYAAELKLLGIALDHHYAHNSHHPEHYKGGINDMNLFDIVEMLMDWKAASERHDDGNIVNSIIHNRQRFGMSNQLVDIFLNTVEHLGWASKHKSYEKRTGTDGATPAGAGGEEGN